MAVQRKIWFLEGTLKLGLKDELLDKVMKIYENLKLVPTHYNYPILWAQEAKPAFLTKIETSKLTFDRKLTNKRMENLS